MTFPHATFSLSIRTVVVGALVLTSVLLASIAIALHYAFSKSAAVSSTLSRFQQSAIQTGEYIAAMDSKATEITRLLAEFPRLTRDNSVDEDTRDLFAQIMLNNPRLYAIYIGFGNGNFYELVNLDSSPAVRRRLNADNSDRWVVITVGEGPEGRWRAFEFFDKDFRLRTSTTEPSDYDPSKRLWYTRAGPNQVYKTRPYLFQHLQAPGQTFSIALPESNAVLAVDIALSTLSDYLAAQPFSDDSEIFLYQENGELIAHNQHRSSPRQPIVPALPLSSAERDYLASLGKIRVSNETNWPPIDYAVAGQPMGYSVELVKLIAEMAGFEVEFINGYDWPGLLRLFNQGDIEILQPIFNNPGVYDSGLTTQKILDVPFAMVTRERAYGNAQLEIDDLPNLAGKTLAIPKGWSIIPIIRAQHPSITILEAESPKAALEAVLNGNAYATVDVSAVLHYTVEQYFMEGLAFHENVTFQVENFPDTLHLLVSPENQKLAEIINRALNHIPETYLGQMRSRWLTWQESPLVDPISTVPYQQLLQSANSGELGTMQEVIVGGEPKRLFVSELSQTPSVKEYFGVMIPERVIVADSIDRARTTALIIAACLLIMIPGCWLLARPIVAPIRRLVELSRKTEKRQKPPLEIQPELITEFRDLASAFTSMAGSFIRHQRELEELMESFIQLVAHAIDEKSPYTAAHCDRVPELSIMLAREAEKSSTPPFDQFNFSDEQAFKEFSIAAWLHDCGKITTPEHIVDKGTKLETIYNRIHEIRTRFEVLWRDEEILYLQQLLTMPEHKATLMAQKTANQGALKEEFAFVAQVNLGGESLSPQDSEKLETLARRTWTRHFSNRLGLSTAELARFSEQEQLPATESLLQDRSDHIIPRHRDPSKEYAQFDIRMSAPEHQYNLGELYNLKIRRGTLTAEDRFKINEHMISTVVMLESLCFPPELARVPRFASTHHETLRGTGYPRGLKGEELSIPERIIAVADIFEALTASDRPYKRAKPVSEAIALLYQKVREGDIDGDVFRLFLSSGVYRQYGEKFLDPDQLDEVDVEGYLDKLRNLKH